MPTTQKAQENREVYVLLEEAKTHRKYKRARHRLLEVVLWDDPAFSMSISLADRTPARDFEGDLRKRMREVQKAFDEWTSWQVQIESNIPRY